MSKKTTKRKLRARQRRALMRGQRFAHKHGLNVRDVQAEAFSDGGWTARLWWSGKDENGERFIGTQELIAFHTKECVYW